MEVGTGSCERPRAPDTINVGFYDQSSHEAAVLEALRAVRDPDLHRDIVTLKFVKNLRIDGGQRGVHASS